MSLESTITKLIRLIARQDLLMQITEGTVTAVDKTANTCTVDRDGLPQLQKVRLNAILEAGTKTITVYPEVGASVLCAIIENNATDAYVIDCNNIESIIINGGENGGLIKIQALIENLNKTNELIQSLIDTINGVTITELGNGAASALQIALQGALTGKTLGEYTGIENELIKH